MARKKALCDMSCPSATQKSTIICGGCKVCARLALHAPSDSLEKTENTTAGDLLVPLSDLGLAQRPAKETIVRVECKQSCPVGQEQKYLKKRL